MALNGEEKIIRASFRELRLHDERLKPQFATLWNAAHFSRDTQRTALDFRVAAAVIVVGVALLSLTLISGYWQPRPKETYAGANGLLKPSANTEQLNKYQELVQQGGNVKLIGKSGRVRSGRRGQTTTKVVAQRSDSVPAVALPRWQSPTASLLQSPSDEILRSFPRPNQTLREMESFLLNRTN